MTLIRCLSALQESYSLGVKIFANTRSKEKADALAKVFPGTQITVLGLEDLPSFHLGSPVDYVIHLASPTASRFITFNPVETIDTIVNGTKSALEFSKANHAGQLLYVSSMEVYGQVLQEKELTEDKWGGVDPTKSRSSYPMGKRMAECLSLCYSQEFGLPVRIARLSQTFGAGIDESDQRVYAQFARQILSHQDIVLKTPGKQSQCFCYTTDVVSALLYILLKGQDQKIYNVGNPSTYMSIRSLAEMLCAKFGNGIRVKVQPDPQSVYPPASFLKLNTDALQELGWQPQVGIHEMFRRLIEYLR